MNVWPVEEFCTLPAAGQPFRLMEFDELFRSHIRPPRRIDPHRVADVLEVLTDRAVAAMGMHER